MMSLKEIISNEKWTLFLDRDGVINKKISNDYVKKWEDFQFIDGSLEAIKIFSRKFETIVIVTNQQGIGKGLMTEADLNSIHTRMLSEIEKGGGRINKIYHCPFLKESNSFLRKPNVGMALKAKKDFPQINFKRAIIVGDSISDLKFGNSLNFKKVYITSDLNACRNNPELIDFTYTSLIDFAKIII